MKYRSKPVCIEAVQWTGENDQEILNLIKVVHPTIHETIRKIIVINTKYNEKIEVLEIHTNSDKFVIPLGRFVLIDKNNELLIRKPETFHKQYERIWNDNDYCI